MNILHPFVNRRSDDQHSGLSRILTWSAAILLTALGISPAMAQQQAVSTDKSIDEIREIFEFFHTPANVVQIQVASDKTLYAWQNMSAFQYTMQIERDGPISDLPEKIDPAIGQINFTRPGKAPEIVAAPSFAIPIPVSAAS